MMSEKLFKLRKYYFSFLYLSFVYLAILMLILGKNVKTFQLDFIIETILIITGIIPATFYLLRKTKYIFTENIYIKLLIVGQIPLLIGFLLSFFLKNYIYFLIAYPIFLLAYLVIIPTKKAVEGKGELS